MRAALLLVLCALAAPARADSVDANRLGSPQTAPRNDSAVEAANLAKMYVYAESGDSLGKVVRVGRGGDGKTYIVVQSGGVAGLGANEVAIPADKLTLQQSGNLGLRGLSHDQLRNLPAWKHDASWRDLSGEERVSLGAS